MTQNGKRTKTDKNTEHILEIQKKNKKTFGTYVYIYIYIHILDIKKKEKQQYKSKTKRDTYSTLKHKLT